VRVLRQDVEIGLGVDEQLSNGATMQNNDLTVVSPPAATTVPNCSSISSMEIFSGDALRVSTTHPIELCSIPNPEIEDIRIILNISFSASILLFKNKAAQWCVTLRCLRTV
jgi:hypothetical protein